jgi:DNA primase
MRNVPMTDIRTLKRSVTIPAVLHARGLLDGMRRRGRHLVGPCPIHHGDNPTALSVDLESDLWYCFTGCQAGGDVIQLVRRLDGVGFREVLRTLADLANLAVPSLPGSYHLPSRRDFQPYTRTLRLQPDVPFLRQKGIKPETAAAFEVGFHGGPGWLSGCIGVRLHDPEGRPLGYAGRTMDPVRVEQFGKWKFPQGLPKSSLLYGYHRVRNLLHRGLIVVECPWGVHRLHQLGLPAVALLGVHLSAAQRELLTAANPLVILLDGDDAWRLAALRIKRERARTDTITIVADLPLGMDPDDLTDRALSSLVSPWLLS